MASISCVAARTPSRRGLPTCCTAEEEAGLREGPAEPLAAAVELSAAGFEAMAVVDRRICEVDVPVAPLDALGGLFAAAGVRRTAGIDADEL